MEQQTRYFHFLLGREGDILISKDEIQRYQRKVFPIFFYYTSLPLLLATVRRQLSQKLFELRKLNPTLNSGDFIYGLKILPRIHSRLDDWGPCVILDVKNWHEVLTNMTRDNNWLLEIYRKYAPMSGENGYISCQKCEYSRKLRTDFPAMLDLEIAVCN
jgi:hypothetical protein